MTQEYNLSQARKKLRTDNKTLQQWLQDTGIEPYPDKKNASHKLITQDQLNLLARLHGRTILPDAPAKSTDPLAALEQRLRRHYEAQVTALRAEMEERITALRRELLDKMDTPEQPTLHTPAVRVTAPRQVATVQSGETIPAGEAVTFLLKHRAVKTVVSRWKGLPFDKQGLLQFALNRHQPLHRCGEQDCPCYEMLPE